MSGDSSFGNSFSKKEEKRLEQKLSERKTPEGSKAWEGFTLSRRTPSSEMVRAGQKMLSF